MMRISYERMVYPLWTVFLGCVFPIVTSGVIKTFVPSFQSDVFIRQYLLLIGFTCALASFFCIILCFYHAYKDAWCEPEQTKRTVHIQVVWDRPQRLTSQRIIPPEPASKKTDAAGFVYLLKSEIGAFGKSCCFRPS